MPINASNVIKTNRINLLPQDEFQSSTFGRILKWALSSFRVMVIVTELIVMSAFLSRFWLDAKNSDLNDELNVSKAQVQAYSDVENEFRLYQKKLSIAKNLYLQNKNSNLIADITKLMPEDLLLSSIQETEGDIQLKAISFSERSVAQFLINLGGLKSLSDVTLSQVASSVDNSFATTFTIDAKLNNQIGGEN
ncbi:MAG: PilN domain-containing protein [Patescibacteria group bacterium]|mgnify:CR=1 FL=1